MVGKKYEAGGIAKDGAKMVMAVANAKVRNPSLQFVVLPVAAMQELKGMLCTSVP